MLNFRFLKCSMVGFVIRYKCTKINLSGDMNKIRKKKLHLLNWDTICLTKCEGGLELKKFNLINQAMLSKQYWRMMQQTNSLLVKTFKAKYYPKTHIFDH